MKKVSLLGILSMLFILVFIQCGKKDPVLATIQGGESITLSEFKKVLTDQYHTTNFSEISRENKEKTLQTLIDSRRKILEAKALKLDTLPEFIDEKIAREDNMIAQKLYELEVVDQLVSEDLIKIFYDLKRHDIKGHLIIVGFKEAKIRRADRNHAEALNLANDLVKRLEKGEDPYALAQQFSSDPAVKKNKGFLDTYAPGMFVLDLDRAIHKAEQGEVVGPIDSEQGIFIFKITLKRKMVGPSDYETAKADIKNRIYQRFYRNEGNRIYYEKGLKFRDELGWAVNDSVIAKFIERAKGYIGGDKPLDVAFSEEERSWELGYIDDLHVTVGSFVDQFAGKFQKYFTRFNTPEKVKKSLDSQIGYKAWVIKGRQRDLDKHEEIETKMSDWVNRKLIALLEQTQIFDKATVSEEEIDQYYEENKGRFKEPRKIELWEIAIKDEQKAKDVYKKVKKSGYNFGEMAQKYSEKPSAKRKGYLGWQSERGHLDQLVTKAFAAGPHKIIGPIKFGIFYYILRTGNKKPERLRPLKEVRDLVIGGIRKEKQHQLRKELEKHLAEKYPQQINQAVFEKLN
ncbi:MAG: hypothetical protein Kow0037_30400 [Calditrichia bacterium]